MARVKIKTLITFHTNRTETVLNGMEVYRWRSEVSGGAGKSKSFAIELSLLFQKIYRDQYW